MLLAVIIVVFIEAVLLTLLFYNYANRGRQEVEKRVSEVVGSRPPTVRERELKAPFYTRAVKPVVDRLTTLAARVLPAEKEAELAQKIDRAGIPEKIAARELLVVKYFAAAGLAAFFWLLGAVIAKTNSQVILMVCAGIGLGWLLPDFHLNRLAQVRRQEVERSMPDVLDLLTVSVEAGLGFDGALMKVVDKTKGTLSREFMIMLQEVKMGKPRSEALRDMSKRVGVDDLSTFTGSVIMAEQLGISMSNILRLQSEQIRQKHRQRAEEMAMKTPVKIIFPLVFFIFPAIFVVLLGPAVIQIINTFAN